MHYISWDEINGLVRLIADEVKQKSIDTIVGISRSGLIPAVMLSHTLGVRNFAVLDIIRTTSDDINAEKTGANYRGILNEQFIKGKNVLLVDDIVGEGMTIRNAKQILKDLDANVVSATLVINQDNLGTTSPEEVVDICGCIVHGWVIFPWEGKEN
ncbi:phosphoribosyltransferase [Aerosakkonemataceae cyanobacterium BLCC-F154]|uniref:Phosphoribosyltransferase n=1 Tax=Floridaenema fluviatile BLCC-F154 TaxID=3153640 RepID=A0ABV4YLD5_9CYAN